ncbi:MAG TPA: hypothetical protein VMR70_10530 [Flavisolibacter sp.]|nr:hypothetical protein [Flavisolibacter sp.]
MKTTFYFALLVLFIFYACSSVKEKSADALTGNWLILYPEHRLTSYRQREVYGRHQDSLISLYGLKLIKLQSDGQFVEIDSLNPRGAKWNLQDRVFKVQEGGKGFNPFTTRFTDLENDTLKLTQFLRLEGEKIKVIWHLKKIDDEAKEAVLFSEEANSWRKVPAAPETPDAMRKRLAAMLDYYGNYYALVSRESIYFSPARVPLPFQYYQHAMGLQTAMPPSFARLFYNADDARKGYLLLERTLGALSNQFERGDNFVAEYGLFLKRMSLHLQPK